MPSFYQYAYRLLRETILDDCFWVYSERRKHLVPHRLQEDQPAWVGRDVVSLITLNTVTHEYAYRPFQETILDVFFGVCLEWKNTSLLRKGISFLQHNFSLLAVYV